MGKVSVTVDMVKGWKKATNDDKAPQTPPVASEAPPVLRVVGAPEIDGRDEPRARDVVLSRYSPKELKKLVRRTLRALGDDVGNLPEAIAVEFGVITQESINRKETHEKPSIAGENREEA